MGAWEHLAAKRAAKYDVELEGRVKTWIEAVIGRPLEGPSFRESLADGVAVCELANAIQPDIIRKIHRTDRVVLQRENFGQFTKACVSLGMTKTDCTSYEDVAQDMNMPQFLACIIGFARIAQMRPDWSGPILEDARAGQRREGLAKGEIEEARYSPGSKRQYIPSVYDEQAKRVTGYKEEARPAFLGSSVQDLNRDGGESAKPRKYVPTAAEEQAKLVTGYKDEARPAFLGSSVQDLNRDGGESAKPRKYVPSVYEEQARVVTGYKDEARPAFLGSSVQDLNRDGGESGKPRKYVPSALEDEARRVTQIKETSRPVATHGIIIPVTSPDSPGGAKEYVPTAAEEAARVAGDAKAASRSVAHGIITYQDGVAASPSGGIVGDSGAEPAEPPAPVEEAGGYGEPPAEDTGGYGAAPAEETGGYEAPAEEAPQAGIEAPADGGYGGEAPAYGEGGGYGEAAPSGGDGYGETPGYGESAYGGGEPAADTYGAPGADGGDFGADAWGGDAYA